MNAHESKSENELMESIYLELVFNNQRAAKAAQLVTPPDGGEPYFLPTHKKYINLDKVVEIFESSDPKPASMRLTKLHVKLDDGSIWCIHQESLHALLHHFGLTDMYQKFGQLI